MKASTIMDRVQGGVYDDDLRSLNEVIIDRIKAIRQEAAFDVRKQLRKGTKVRIREDASIRPKYFLGQRGKVVSLGSTRALVDFGHPVGRYRSEVRIPLDCLEKVA